MKIATIIARVLLGLLFLVFGLNAFFHFMPMPPPPKNEAGAFLGALFSSGYLYAIKCFEVGGGLLLVIGRKVPLGLVVAALSLFLLWAYRKAFAGLLSQ